MSNIPTVTIRWVAIASVGLSLVLHAEDASHRAPPATAEHDVVENYHGREVHDPYRWLEQAGAPAVEQWIDAQNAYTNAVMSGFRDHGVVIERASQLALTSTQRSNPQIVANVLFYMRQTPPQPQAVLVAEAWPNGESKVIVDTNATTGDTAITDYWPSPDGPQVTEATVVRICICYHSQPCDAFSLTDLGEGRSTRRPVRRLHHAGVQGDSMH